MVFKNLKRKLLAPISNQRGAALVMAISTLTILIIIATDLAYETTVESIVSHRDINEVQAFYAAQAGVELSLVRIRIFHKVSEALKDYSDMIDPAMIDFIWSFPFSWPPPIPQDTMRMTQREMQESIHESLMDVSYVTAITAEGSKININLLGSPIEALEQIARQQLINLVQSRINHDTEFARSIAGIDVNRIFDHIADWIDASEESRSGGFVSGHYSHIDERNRYLPPNQAFSSLTQLRMIPDMTPELYDFLVPHLTLYSDIGINPNLAPKNILMSAPGIDEFIAEQIIQRREDPMLGPFLNAQSFINYIQQIGVRETPFGSPFEGQIPLNFDPVSSFKIESIGRAGQVHQAIEALVFDPDLLKWRVSQFLNQTESDEEQPPDEDPPEDPKPPSLQPRILYWKLGR